MNHTRIFKILTVLFAVVLCFGPVGLADPLGTAFTYQGRLIDANKAADGLYDFQFKLFDANSGGNKLGTDINKPNIDVIDGYFTVELDYGNVFDGNNRWLDIGVRPGDQNDPCVYSVLSPRQKLTPAPYAIYTASAPGGSGVSVPLILSGSFSGAIIDATNTGSGDGVAGTSSNGYGVFGTSSSWQGVRGNSTSGTGVYGFNGNSGNSGSLGTSNYGVSGSSTNGTGVSGSSSNGDGVAGTSSNGYGVSGTSSSWQGVRGDSTSGTGVYGFNSNSGNSGSLGTSNYGVSGSSTSGTGVSGSSSNGYGVSGTSSSWQGVRGSSTSGTGVYGFNVTTGNSGSLGTNTYGVYGSSSSGYAGYFSGNVYVTANVSALSYTDRTPYPKDLATAYQAVMSMERLPDGQYQENNKEEQLDHSKLSDFIRSKDGSRDLSATVSCQNEVIKDLIKQNKELIGQNKELNKRLEALEQKPAERIVK